MAIAFESVATTAFNNTNGMTIPKPSGLAVGDLMVSHAVVNGASVGDVTLPSGFTLVAGEDTTLGYARVIASKIADSSDVAATDFAFGTGGTAIYGGAIYRISGGGESFVISSFVTSNAGGSESWAIGITPTYASSMLLFFCSQRNTSGNAGVMSGYAIATDNPTWTEAYDFNTIALGDDFSMNSAYAVRTQTTGTGNFTANGGGGSFNWRGILIAVAPSVNASLSPSVQVVPVITNTPTAGLTVTAGVNTVTVTTNTPTVTNPTPDWSNIDKSTAPNWVNPDKS